MFAICGKSFGPRLSARPWIVFLLVDKAVCVLGLGLGLFGDKVVGDVGICIALFSVYNRHQTVVEVSST